MMKLITYNQKGDALFEFNFKYDDIEFNPLNSSVLSLKAIKQTYYFNNMSFIAYNTDLNFLSISSEWLSLSKQLIEQAYKEEDKIILIFSTTNEPIGMFKGKSSSLKYPINTNNSICKILIDDKPIWLSNMNFIVIGS